MFKNMSKILLVLIPLLVLACTEEPSVEKKDSGPYMVVKFNTQGGSSVSSLTMQKGERITAPTNPTEANLAFLNWNTKADGTGTTWNFGAATVTANITLYAQWTNDFHTVTFNHNYGSPAKTTVVNVAKGTTTTALLVSRTGYILDYWKDVSNVQTWNFATVVTADITLSAQWTELHKVTFNHNYGAASTVVNVRHQSLVDAPTISRQGYVFAHWNKKADGNGDAWDFAKTLVTAEVTLYAQWTELHKVTFNHNYGATSTVANVKDGGTLSAPSAISRTGYAFVNWNTKADGTGTAWAFATDIVTADMTLYAKWTDDFYTVTFNHNYGGSLARTTLVNVAKGATVSTLTVSRPKYAFVYWNTKADGTGIIWDFTDVVTADMTLYAKWKSE